jgi:serine/threonine protein kinase
MLRADSYAAAPRPQVTPSCSNLMTRLLDPDPDLRITVREALQHPWIAADPAAADPKVCRRCSLPAALRICKSDAVLCIYESASQNMWHARKSMLPMAENCLAVVQAQLSGTAGRCTDALLCCTSNR